MVYLHHLLSFVTKSFTSRALALSSMLAIIHHMHIIFTHQDNIYTTGSKYGVTDLLAPLSFSVGALPGGLGRLLILFTLAYLLSACLSHLYSLTTHTTRPTTLPVDPPLSLHAIATSRSIAINLQHALLYVVWLVWVIRLSFFCELLMK